MSTQDQKQSQATDTISNFVNQKQKEFQQKSGENNNNSGENQNKVDNNQNNSYNKGEQQGSQSASQETPTGESDEVTKYQQMLQNTFGGDANKAVKSYVEAQRQATKLAQEKKQYDQTLDSNPKLKEIWSRVSQGESIENLLGSGKDSQKEKPSSAPESKLNEQSFDDINDYLISKGYLDNSKKDNLTDDEWQMEVQKATTKALPEYMAEKSFKQFQTKLQQEDQRRKQEQTKNYLRSENEKRYDSSFENAIQMGFDFAGEHAPLLDEIHSEMRGFRDPQNPNLLRNDAFELATQMVANRNGISMGNRNKPQQQQGGNINYNNRTQRSVSESYDGNEPAKWDGNKPNVDYLRHLRAEQNKKQQQYRQNLIQGNKK